MCGEYQMHCGKGTLLASCSSLPIALLGLTTIYRAPTKRCLDISLQEGAMEIVAIIKPNSVL